MIMKSAATHRAILLCFVATAIIPVHLGHGTAQNEPLRATEPSPASPHVSAVHQAHVGERVSMTCPVESCADGNEPYNWTKFVSLDSAHSSAVYSFEKTLSFEVEGATDGGYYRCFSLCEREFTKWVKLESKYSLS